MNLLKKLNSENVAKYVFNADDSIVEAVLYKYPDFITRTVLCISVMSGCPVGCSFCGTGKKFIKNLTSNEISYQVDFIFQDNNIETQKVEKLQIMFMSMGEPLLNFANVKSSIKYLNKKYSNAQLLLSTVGINNPKILDDLLELSKEIGKIGLQFSIHKSNNFSRNKLIPYENKMELNQIRDYAIKWAKATHRPVFLNYCIDGTNNTNQDFINLCKLFNKEVFYFTFSVICSKNETMKECGFKNLNIIKSFEKLFIDSQYNTRIFNPDGQDDIGGGCGQLWYFQNYIKEHNSEERT